MEIIRFINEKKWEGKLPTIILENPGIIELLKSYLNHEESREDS